MTRKLFARKFKKTGALHFAGAGKGDLSFYIVYLLAVALGAVLKAQNSGFLSEFTAYAAQKEMSLKVSEGFFSLFWGFMAPELIYLVLTAICALSAFGTPELYLLTFARGVGFGAAAAYYYTSGKTGVLYALAVQLPQNALVSAFMISAAFRGCRAGNAIFRFVFSRETDGKPEEDGELRTALLRCAVAVVAGALIQTAAFRLLRGRFA